MGSDKPAHQSAEARHRGHSGKDVGDEIGHGMVKGQGQRRQNTKEVARTGSTMK